MINSNITITGITYDINGNKIIKVKLSDNGGFSIQINGNLKNTSFILKRLINIKNFHALQQKQIDVIENEIIDYIQNFGTKKQKKDLITYQ